MCLSSSISLGNFSVIDANRKMFLSRKQANNASTLIFSFQLHFKQIPFYHNKQPFVLLLRSKIHVYRITMSHHKMQRRWSPKKKSSKTTSCLHLVYESNQIVYVTNRDYIIFDVWYLLSLFVCVSVYTITCSVLFVDWLGDVLSLGETFFCFVLFIWIHK